MRTTDKNRFRVFFEGIEYQVYHVDFKGNAKDYVYIKAKMVLQLCGLSLKDWMNL